MLQREKFAIEQFFTKTITKDVQIVDADGVIFVIKLQKLKAVRILFSIFRMSLFWEK
jgi:hypothetical protein